MHLIGEKGTPTTTRSGSSSSCGDATFQFSFPLLGV